MYCMHCFVVDLVKELVGEGGSRSASRVHEHDSSQLVYNRIWQSGYSEVDVNLVQH